MYVDFVHNGVGSGEVGEALQGVHFDKGLLRPFVDRRGVKRVVMNTGRTEFDPKTRTMKPIYADVQVHDVIHNMGINHPVLNATTALRKEEWIELDKVALRAARWRLRAWADLAAANSFGGFNGMSKLSLEHETMSDPGEANVDMDGMTEGRNDMPLFQLEALPLPITHSDFWVSSRKLAISRNTGTPFDTTMGEAAARRVAESVEKTTIGVNTGITYGPGSNSPATGRTSAVYGYTNFTARLTYSGTAPNGSNASTILANVLAMRQTLYSAKFTGPYMIYHSNDWDQYLDADYILTGGNVATQTLRKRLEAIEGVMGVRRLDFLFAANPAPVASNGTPNPTGSPGMNSYDNVYPFTMIMVQMTQEVARAVNGMDITTVQWESQGGMRLNFKVMCIQVPQLRADFYNQCGILHGTFT